MIGQKESLEVSKDKSQFNFQEEKIASISQKFGSNINLPNTNPTQSKQRNTNLKPNVNSDFIAYQSQLTVG